MPCNVNACVGDSGRAIWANQTTALHLANQDTQEHSQHDLLGSSIMTVSAVNASHRPAYVANCDK